MNEVRYVERDKILETNAEGEVIVSCTVLVLQQLVYFPDKGEGIKWVDVPTVKDES